ncbi:hypothetical protein ACFQE1_21400, partial [Halobium palmae]
YALSAEDAAYYLRYLEGQGVRLLGRNSYSAGGATDGDRSGGSGDPSEETGGDAGEASTATVETAEQRLNEGTAYDAEILLVVVDREEGGGVVGGSLVAESYEEAEGFPVDTSRYGNFPFVTNLLDALSDREGPVLVDGGHGQFNADYALSAEDAAYYLRYLEGQGVRLLGRNSYSAGGATDGDRSG